LLKKYLMLFIVLYISVGCSSKAGVKVVSKQECTSVESGHAFSLEFLEQRYSCKQYAGEVK
jgi:uncharacterized protein YcfL